MCYEEETMNLMKNTRINKGVGEQVPKFLAKTFYEINSEQKLEMKTQNVNLIY